MNGIITHESLKISNEPFTLDDIDKNDKVIMKMLNDNVDLYLIKLYQTKKKMIYKI